MWHPSQDITSEEMSWVKQKGFSDAQIARYTGERAGWGDVRTVMDRVGYGAAGPRMGPDGTASRARACPSPSLSPRPKAIHTSCIVL